MEEVLTDILIVGGGVAGAAVASSLKDSGLKMMIIEPRAEGHDMNRGDVLFPCSIAIIKEFGALEKLAPKGMQFSTMGVLSHTKPIIELNLAKMNPEFPFGLTIDHVLIEDTLLEHAKSERLTIMRGFTVQEILVARDGVHGAILAGKGNKIVVKAKLIIGADGRNSMVRESLGIKSNPKDYPTDLFVFTMPLTEPYLPGIFVYVNPPQYLFVHALTGNRLRIGIEVKKGTSSEWLAKSKEEKMAFLSSFSPIFSNVKPEFEGEHLYTLRKNDAERYYKGKAVIIGDAAHEVHPMSSQGMATALADAYVLSKILENSLENLDKKLQRFERIRKPIMKDTIKHSDFIAKAFGTKIPAQKQLISVVEHFGPLKAILSKEFSVFEYKYMSKTGIKIN